MLGVEVGAAELPPDASTAAPMADSTSALLVTTVRSLLLARDDAKEEDEDDEDEEDEEDETRTRTRTRRKRTPPCCSRASRSSRDRLACSGVGAGAGGDALEAHEEGGLVGDLPVAHHGHARELPRARP